MHVLSDGVDGGAHDVLAAVGVQVDDDASQVDGNIVPQSGGADFDVVVDSLSSPVSSFSDHLIEDVSLSTLEPDILLNFSMHASVSPPSHSGSFDLLKAPSSFAEAHAQSDASVWRAAMDREKRSLDEMGAFEEADLPPGERVIGLKWVYAFKTDADGHNIPGKEKARVVAQGFNQRPSQYDETYTPVAKMASVRLLLAWAAVQDLKIFQFNCKTAFLHAKIRHPLYVRQIPGYPLSHPQKVLRILIALYSLHQSAYEFYMLFLSLLLSLGMVHCEADHGIFFGEWTSPPDSSVHMPVNGSPLVLYAPIHVDDGLAITNSPSLYAWFLKTLANCLMIVDLGQCAKFLSILIIHDRPNHHLWLSSHVYIAELLEEWNLTDCRPASVRGHPHYPIPITKPDNHGSAPAPTYILTHYIPPHRQVYSKNPIVT